MRTIVGGGFQTPSVTILLGSCILAPQVSQASKPHGKGPFRPGARLSRLRRQTAGGVPVRAQGNDAGQIKIVGVEGGEHPAFKDAPYYDPAALMNERIIIAAFNTGADLPTGRTRIATIHLQIIGDAEPKYELSLTTAADANGENLPAEITLEKGEQK